MRLQGKIDNWDDDKGFGFVEPNGGGERAFVHIKAWKNRYRRPTNGDVIIYEVTRECNQRYKAINVQFSKDIRRSNKGGDSKLNSQFDRYFLLSFILILITSTTLSKLPLLVPLHFLLMSITTFILYALDKSAARQGRWRRPENTLHLLSLIGGWPGALLAQRKLRHKSSKISFQRVYKATVILNVGVICLLHTTEGALVIDYVIALPYVSYAEHAMLEYIIHIQQVISDLFVV